MAFCSKCGTELPEEAKVCPDCGQSTAPETQKGAGSQTADKIGEALSDLGNTADTTAEYSAEDIEKNKILALFAYLGILILVPALAAKDSKFARFHVNQGLVLLIVYVAYAIVMRVISLILGIIPIIGWITVGVLSLCGLVFVGLMIFGIVNAVTGKAKELPVIGRIRILK